MLPGQLVWKWTSLAVQSNYIVEKYSLDVESEVCQILSRGKGEAFGVGCPGHLSRSVSTGHDGDKAWTYIYFFISRLGSQFLSIEKDWLELYFFPRLPIHFVAALNYLNNQSNREIRYSTVASATENIQDKNE